MCLFSMAILQVDLPKAKAVLWGDCQWGRPLGDGWWISMDVRTHLPMFFTMYPSDHTGLLGQGHSRFLHVIHLISFWPVLSSSGRTGRWQGSFTAVQLNHEAVGYQYSTRVRTQYNTLQNLLFFSFKGSPHTSKGRLLLPKWWPMARPECVDIV